MKKNFRFMAMAAVAVAAAVFTGCSSDDDFLLTSSMRTPKPIIKQWCDPLMTFHKHCSCYSLLTLR